MAVKIASAIHASEWRVIDSVPLHRSPCFWLRRVAKAGGCTAVLPVRDFVQLVQPQTESHSLKRLRPHARQWRFLLLVGIRLSHLLPFDLWQRRVVLAILPRDARTQSSLPAGMPKVECS